MDGPMADEPSSSEEAELRDHHESNSPLPEPLEGCSQEARVS